MFSFADNIQCDLLKSVGGVKESVSDFGKTLSKMTYLDKVTKSSPTKDETSRCTSLTNIPKDTLNTLQDTATSFLSFFNLTNPLDLINQLSSTVLTMGSLPKKLLDDIIEGTTDIFFSIPTVFTAEFWSTSAQSFVYSFNFMSKSSIPGGEIFLPQLPLIQSQKQVEKVAHGDDLVFLFEPRDIFGNPIGNLMDGAHRVKRIVGGIQAKSPPRDDPVVFIYQPTKTIRIEGLQQDQRGFYSFLGIPYADPPIGKNRFVRARLRKLVGDFEAKKYPDPCPQPSANNEQEIVGQEDCLKLNIHTPEMPDPDTKLPVIIFLHGGGFRFGSASQYDPRHLIGQKVLFVGVQYRLGSLGILGLGSKEIPSNGALSDCVAAVRWTHKYIQFFGGDPEKVTILGHGSGAALAIMLSMSKFTNPLIRGIVAMSGSAISPHAVDLSPIKSFGNVHRINRCTRENSLKIFKCLQNIPATDIIRGDSDIQLLPQNSDLIADLSGFLGFSPNVEDIDDRRGLPGILTEYPNNFFASGHFNS
uniref:carboxylesterase n=1 Tax=Phlebotomus papatasi TaxID=29031 RepID=A0A1B0DKS7_PHLPP